MNTTKLRTVAKEIVRSGKVSKVSAKKIESLLSTAELSKLAEYIAVEQDKETVHLAVSDTPSKKTTDSISSLFGGKRVITTVDKTIGAGVKVSVYDMIYDLTIKTKINNLVERLGEEV